MSKDILTEVVAGVRVRVRVARITRITRIRVASLQGSHAASVPAEWGQLSWSQSGLQPTRKKAWAKGGRWSYETRITRI